ncbi:glutamate 5-kinase [Streptomyces apocyni]|uniref:glutamate 5-kinase n=1 Tax=Streptomyces apocyni TaxID=2654677 RepID=UPI0012EA3B51|nr:glutamate 5-kinase [Streptomyces apocyni]
MSDSPHPDRVVIKIGTSSLVTDGNLDPAKADSLAASVAGLVRDGLRPVLVTSGAIALGAASLGGARTEAATTRQLAAAVGQGALFEAFRSRLADHGLTAAQFLFTPVDLLDDRHRDGIKSVLGHALDRGVIPVVNENDAVQVRNNDILAALLSVLLQAHRLMLLTDVPGLYGSDPRTDPDARLVPEVKGMTVELERLAGASGTGPGSGGMVSKLGAAWITSLAGVTTVIAAAGESDVLARALRGEPVGTVVHPCPAPRGYDLGQLWRAFAGPPRGTVTVLGRVAHDGGAVPLSSVARTEGTFAVGDIVDIVARDGRPVARGRTRASSRRLAELCASEDVTERRSHDMTVLHHTEYVTLQEVC